MPLSGRGGVESFIITPWAGNVWSFPSPAPDLFCLRNLNFLHFETNWVKTFECKNKYFLLNCRFCVFEHPLSNVLSNSLSSSTHSNERWFKVDKAFINQSINEWSQIVISSLQICDWLYIESTSGSGNEHSSPGFQLLSSCKCRFANISLLD